MHESEKWKWSRAVMYDSLRPHGLQPTRLLCPWDFPGKSTGVGAIAFSDSIAELYGNCMLTFVIEYELASHSDYTILHSHQ